MTIANCLIGGIDPVNFKRILNYVECLMDDDYYGIKISAVACSDRWKWQITLPAGAVITSGELYDRPEQAILQGRHWITVETTFQALNNCLGELRHQGTIHQREHCDLLQSLVQITQYQSQTNEQI